MTTQSIIEAIVREWNEWGEGVYTVAENNGYNLEEDMTEEERQEFLADFIYDEVYSYCGNEPRAAEIREALVEELA